MIMHENSKGPHGFLIIKPKSFRSLSAVEESGGNKTYSFPAFALSGFIFSCFLLIFWCCSPLNSSFSHLIVMSSLFEGVEIAEVLYLLVKLLCVYSIIIDLYISKKKNNNNRFI